MKEKGFSLIELLIVVAIIGVVSAIAVPNVLKARKAAYGANAVRYMKSWLPGQEMYKRVHGNYADNDEVLIQEKFINAALRSDNTADDIAYNYSIDSETTIGGAPNISQWYGRARRKSAYLATLSYYIDQTGVIRARAYDTADVTDPPID